MSQARELPAFIARYEIQARLGEGAMGTVYKARDPQLDRTVAIKTVRNDLGLSDESYGEYKLRFFQEAKAAGRLNHPNIVAIYDVMEVERTPYIVMEYVESDTLGSVLKARGALPVDQAIGIARQICLALDYAHAHGIVHRDIKPANILIGKTGEVKVSDFGIARIEGQDVTMTGALLGTPSYMSPEQITGSRVDGRSDVFSLGAVLYEALTGGKPFKGKDTIALLHSIVNEEPVPVHERNPLLHAGLDAVTARALAKNRDQRYPSARAFENALGEVMLGKPPDTVLAAPPPRAARPDGAPRTRSRRSALVGVAVIVLAIGAGLAWWPSTPPERQRPEPPTTAPDKTVDAKGTTSPPPAPSPRPATSEPAGSRPAPPVSPPTAPSAQGPSPSTAPPSAPPAPSSKPPSTAPTATVAGPPESATAPRAPAPERPSPRDGGNKVGLAPPGATSPSASPPPAASAPALVPPSPAPPSPPPAAGPSATSGSATSPRDTARSNFAPPPVAESAAAARQERVEPPRAPAPPKAEPDRVTVAVPKPTEPDRPAAAPPRSAAIAPNPSSAAPRGDIAGRWQGRYQCQREQIGFSLNVTSIDGNRIAAVFEFFPLPGTQSIPRGSFNMSGEYDRTDGSVRLRSAGWIQRPLGFQSHDIEGQLDPNGETINGRVLTTGCAHFVLAKK